MRVSKQAAAAHRAAIVEAAGRLFRERGFDGVSVAEITRAAGLTHGGFYGHFASKDALAAEALGAVFDRAVTRVRGEVPADLAGYLEAYLSEAHRDRRSGDCPMAATVSEIDRQPAELQRRFGDGVERFIEGMAERLAEPRADAADGAPAAARREQAIALVAALVGGLALSRATAEADPALSREILEALRRQLAPATESR